MRVSARYPAFVWATPERNILCTKIATTPAVLCSMNKNRVVIVRCIAIKVANRWQESQADGVDTTHSSGLPQERLSLSLGHHLFIMRASCCSFLSHLPTIFATKKRVTTLLKLDT